VKLAVESHHQHFVFAHVEGLHVAVPKVSVIADVY
jgi:hypothetical protein